MLTATIQGGSSMEEVPVTGPDRVEEGRRIHTNN